MYLFPIFQFQFSLCGEATITTTFLPQRGLLQGPRLNCTGKQNCQLVNLLFEYHYVLFGPTVFKRWVLWEPEHNIQILREGRK